MNGKDYNSSYGMYSSWTGVDNRFDGCRYYIVGWVGLVKVDVRTLDSVFEYRAHYSIKFLDIILIL